MTTLGIFGRFHSSAFSLQITVKSSSTTLVYLVHHHANLSGLEASKPRPKVASGARLAAYLFPRKGTERSMRHLLFALVTLIGVVMVATGAAHAF
jgi:hypothetical protein